MVEDSKEKLVARRRRAAKILRSTKSTEGQRSWAGKVLSEGSAGSTGGKARARNLSPERRKEIAQMGGKAAAAKLKRRWKLIRAIEEAEEKARKEVIDKLLEVQDEG